MNELLHELATQAGMVMYPTGLGISENTMWGDRNIEKFALLLLEECMDCAQWVGKVNKNPVEPIHTAHAVNKRIKQRFGIDL